MNRNEKGMVLLTTLMMISILTLLVLSLMQRFFLYLKLNQQVMIRHETLFQLESMAKKIRMEKEQWLKSSCRVKGKDPNQVIQALIQKKGCSLRFEGQNYAYLIDELGDYPCLRIKLAHQWFSSRHFLLNLASLHSAQIILQLRIAEPIKLSPCEQEETREINQGILSWRYLS